MFLFIEKKLVSPELAKPSQQLILQGESLQTSLLSIQIDKYKHLYLSIVVTYPLN